MVNYLPLELKACKLCELQFEYGLIRGASQTSATSFRKLVRNLKERKKNLHIILSLVKYNFSYSILS